MSKKISEVMNNPRKCLGNAKNCRVIAI